MPQVDCPDLNSDDLSLFLSGARAADARLPTLRTTQTTRTRAVR